MLSEGFVGGSGRLFGLERLAWQCHEQTDQDSKIICAGIAHLFDRIAKRQEGEAVLAEQASRLCNRISQPLLHCLDAMSGKDSGVSSIDLVGNLVASYEAWSLDERK